MWETTDGPSSILPSRTGKERRKSGREKQRGLGIKRDPDQFVIGFDELIFSKIIRAWHCPNEWFCSSFACMVKQILNGHWGAGVVVP